MLARAKKGQPTSKAIKVCNLGLNWPNEPDSFRQLGVGSGCNLLSLF